MEEHRPAAAPKKDITPAQIVILCLLLIFVTPAGLIYAAWLIAGKKGLTCGCGCLLLPVLLLLLYIWLVNISETGEMEQSVDWLKEEDASEISYYISHVWTAYEYKTSEENFLKHANPAWRFKEIKEPVTVSRYLLMTKYKGNPCGGTLHESKAVVKNGIYAEERWKNGGGYIAVYDRDTGKAYIQRNAR